MSFFGKRISFIVAKNCATLLLELSQSVREMNSHPDPEKKRVCFPNPKVPKKKTVGKKTNLFFQFGFWQVGAYGFVQSTMLFHTVSTNTGTTLVSTKASVSMMTMVPQSKPFRCKHGFHSRK